MIIISYYHLVEKFFLTLQGPALSVWYRAVDGFFKGTPQIALIKKVAADQVSGSSYSDFKLDSPFT